MRISDMGIIEIAEHEGIVPAPYRDSKGIWTFGIGHTAAAGGLNPQEVNRSMPTGRALDEAVDRAILQFDVDLDKYEKRVNDAIKVPLRQHEFDALVSFDFNTGGIFRALLTDAINRGDKDASKHFMGWLKPPEIYDRRNNERRLFNTGDYDANGNLVPIWRTDGRGNLKGVVGQMSGRAIIERMNRKSPSVPSVDIGWKGIFNAIMGLFK